MVPSLLSAVYRNFEVGSSTMQTGPDPVENGEFGISCSVPPLSTNADNVLLRVLLVVLVEELFNT